MSDPKRWSSTGSDVDPVLRSVLRYARDVAPTPSEARALLHGVQAAEAASRAIPALRPPRPALRARALFVAAASMVAFAALVWAGYGLHAARVAPEHALATEPEPRSAAQFPPRPRAAPSASSVEAPTRDAPAASSPRTARDSAAPASSASLDDAGWLQAARRVVISNPSRALALTREHAQRFPHSPLAEERSALRIEALSRVGRSEQARRAFADFERAYPRSPYRHRLQALLAP